MTINGMAARNNKRSSSGVAVNGYQCNISNRASMARAIK